MWLLKQHLIGRSRISGCLPAGQLSTLPIENHNSGIFWHIQLQRTTFQACLRLQQEITLPKGCINWFNSEKLGYLKLCVRISLLEHSGDTWMSEVMVSFLTGALFSIKSGMVIRQSLLSVSYEIRHSIRRFSQRSRKNTLFCCRDVGMGSSSCEHQISLFLEEHHLCWVSWRDFLLLRGRS